MTPLMNGVRKEHGTPAQVELPAPLAADEAGLRQHVGGWVGVPGLDEIAVSGNVLHLGSVAVGDQAVDQVGHAEGLEPRLRP